MGIIKDEMEKLGRLGCDEMEACRTRERVSVCVIKLCLDRDARKFWGRK